MIKQVAMKKILILLTIGFYNGVCCSEATSKTTKGVGGTITSFFNKLFRRNTATITTDKSGSNVISDSSKPLGVRLKPTTVQAQQDKTAAAINKAGSEEARSRRNNQYAIEWNDSRYQNQGEPMSKELQDERAAYIDFYENGRTETKE